MTAMLILGTLGVLGLGVLAFGKYKDLQTEKRSEELRNLYSTVHSDRARR
jgi:hypothetical protein